MSEYVPREEFEALKEQVEQLQSQLEGDDPTTSADTSGLDHRDKSVLEYVEENGDPGPRGTVYQYKNRTDISNSKTAKDRAKYLRGHSAFKKVVSE